MTAPWCNVDSYMHSPFFYSLPTHQSDSFRCLPPLNITTNITLHPRQSPRFLTSQMPHHVDIQPAHQPFKGAEAGEPELKPKLEIKNEVKLEAKEEEDVKIKKEIKMEDA